MPLVTIPTLHYPESSALNLPLQEIDEMIRMCDTDGDGQAEISTEGPSSFL